MLVSRRNLLKSAAATAAAAVAGCAATVAFADEAGTDIVWDAEYDVVVAGFGFAGASASLAAAEAGANVLLAEKAPLNHEGGNSRYAGQICMSLDPADRDTCITYYKNLRGLYTDQSDEVIECIVDGLSTTAQWMLDHGATEEDLVFIPFPEYAEFEGSEGSRAMMYRGIWESQLYKFVHSLVLAEENITFWSDSPVVELIQDRETRAILGVVVEHDGQRYNVHAVNGVVMALGGFENNQAMLQNFCQQPDAYAKGARYNTGDGVKMAIEVGADLWHMSTLSGSDVNFISPLTNNAQAYLTCSNVPGSCFTGFPASSCIIVGGEGKRFVNETYVPRHGHIDYGGTYRTMLVPDNCWCVFDEAARLGGKPYYCWSEGMVDEIENGWIVKADTLEELAGLCGIDAEGLVAQVAQYNQFCADGSDPVCGRLPEYLVPLAEEGPYYAFPIRPTNTNTQGGARRNTACEVVTPRGEAIPHLYSAGEFGSFYCDIYNGGGNIGECFFTGKMAGTAAAAEKDDAFRCGAGAGPDFTAHRPEFQPEADNEFIGVGSGIGGDLVVKVTTEGEKVSGIEVLYHNETPGIGNKAIDQLCPRLVEEQVVETDAVTGATVTSKALFAAVKDALGMESAADAGIDMEYISSSLDLEKFEAAKE